ncbi:TetR/AcrR family transcriptional regulator [Enteroscipio rubneri]|uniref:TetR/AcrR family transcriptional regulator n=1 Tax=Enteroscipio rubneri TaxID=2070686 RepID=UPI003AB7305B
MAKQTKGKDTPTEPAVGTSVESLRERKRRETRAAIERSAITLVDELGYENVTVAMIAERAVVSQGTFFNYFPTKDAAIVGLGPLDLDPQAVHAAYDRLAPAAPYHATLSLFLEVVRELDWTSDIAAMRGRLVAQTPVLMRLFLDGTFAFVADFRSMLASYLEGHPERRTCSDELTAAEEASLVVSEALEAAKFALARATKDLERGLPEADEVEAIVRKIVG